MKLSKHAADMTTQQSMDTMKIQLGEFTNLMGQLQTLMQNFEANKGSLNQTMQQLETQVQSIQQAQAKQQEVFQQVQQTDDDLFTRTAKGKKKSKHSLEPMPEHPTPRDTEHNSKLPPFWRRNLDYGESPYMNLDKIKKITDEVPHGKKRKKKN